MLVYNALLGGGVGCSGYLKGALQPPPEYSKITLRMPFFIFKVWRETRALERLHTFTDAPLTEADTYRRAEAQLRELRRSADPRGGYYVHLIYGETEQDAGERLLAQLSQ